MSDQPHASGVGEQKVLDKPVNQNTSEQEQSRAAEQYHDQKNNQATSLQVKVHSPFREYYDGQAFSVSAENETGPFDILPNHHNFITLLQPCDVLIRTLDKGDQRIRISGGIMHVKANQAVIFLDV